MADPNSSQDGFQKKKGQGLGARIFFFIFGLPFFGLGVAFMWFGALKPLLNKVGSLGWEQLECRILSSGLDRQQGEDGYTYKLEVVYEYRWEGQFFQGDTYNFTNQGSGNLSKQQEILNQFPEGSTQVCWVNPGNPAEAVLVRTTGWTPYFLLPFSAIFALVGLGCMAAGVLGKFSGDDADGVTKGFQNKGKRGKPKSIAGTPSGIKDLRPGVFPPYDPNPLLLKPEVGRIAGLIGITFIALFWNGIVGVFVYHLVDEAMRGSMNWFLVIFLIPFVLVGLGLIWGIIYTFLGLFNPQVELTLTPGTPRLGEPCMLSWRFEGNTGRIQHFKLVLEAEELATYRRGTSTYTDRNIFEQVVLVDQDKATFLESGTIDFALPHDTVPSFKSSNNQILWSVKLQGSIPRWPDVSAAFPLVVMPFQSHS